MRQGVVLAQCLGHWIVTERSEFQSRVPIGGIFFPRQAAFNVHIKYNFLSQGQQCVKLAGIVNREYHKASFDTFEHGTV